MREYITYGVRLPLDASALIDREAERTGIQKSVFLRSVILNWIEKEHDALPDPHLGGSNQAATSNTPEAVTNV